MTDAISDAVDVCVVGAGPAGLAAAARIAEHGLRVVLLDEQPRPGGQYFRQVSPAVAATSGEHRPAGQELIRRVIAAGVQVRTSATVWGVADDGRSLLTYHAGRAHTGVAALSARHIVVATGATERSLPFPGWTSPRVTTVGYAQHLAAEGVPVGQRVLVAGSGPFLLPVACSLLERGATVLAVVEAGRPYRLDRPAPAALRHPARLAEFARYRARLARARVPIRSQTRVVSADESADGLAVVVEGASPATRRTYAVDALCVGYGFRAQVDLLRLLGVRTVVDPASGDEIVPPSADGSTDVTGVWAAGEVSGIAGAECARAEGEVVAAGVLAAEGIVVDVSAARSAVATARRFAATLNARYPAPRDLAGVAVAALPDDALVCRCESVSAGRIRAATECTGADIDAAKSATRAGMGPCQGRECAPALAALCGAPSTAFTPRSPLRPIPLGAIAAGAPL
jgi:NADPH-dependent 2,4-dienoyl-CoA reductase/sulfur reductase-like enzyme